MSAHAYADDEPDTGEAVDEDAEFRALEALHREKQRQRGGPAPGPVPEWSPRDALTAAIWSRLPADGRGVEYYRLARQIEAIGYPLLHVQMGILGLVLLERAYCAPSHAAGHSVVGRGNDPRTGAATIRTGSIKGGFR